MAGKGLAFWRIWVQPSGASPAWSGRWPCGRGLVLSGVGLQPEPHATNPSPLLLWDLQKLEDQEQRARQLKERLRSKQQSLQRQLEQLRGLAGAAERERLRTDSLDSSGLSSERSDSDQEELEVDVESLVFGGEAELLRGFVAGQEHSYSHGGGAWL